MRTEALIINKTTIGSNRRCLVEGCFALALASVAAMVGCANKTIHPPLLSNDASIRDADFLDLQAGWRLAVVLPLLKPGSDGTHLLQAAGDGNARVFRAGPDLEGYENIYYALRKNGDGVRLQFLSADAVKDGKSTIESGPATNIFDVPSKIRYLRLLYLVRVSNSDHNMAILGTEDAQMLTPLMQQVQAHPEESCVKALRTYCSWTPLGVAIRPEKLASVDGRTQWVPSR